MSFRFLFGPVADRLDRDHLPNACQSGRCIPFGPGDTWASIAQRLPSGWQPDFLALHLAYRQVSPTLWQTPLPIIALAEDWNLLWHSYRRVLPACDLVLTDAAGVAALHRAGIPQARFANLFGLAKSFFNSVPTPEKVWDVLFVGNLHPAVQRERLSWLGRLTRLGERWRVAIRTKVFGDDYRALLSRSRIVFNRSIRGECNRRAFEATACGALLFQEEENQEIALYFRDREECVCYRADNLEALLEHYLTHEDERQALADAGRQRVQAYSFEALWEAALGKKDEWRSAIKARPTSRRPFSEREVLQIRTEQASSCSQGRDESLAADLTQALLSQPHDAPLHSDSGIAVALAGQPNGVVTAPLAEQAARHFQQALRVEPTNPCMALNLVEALVGLQHTALAIEGARRTLALLERTEEWSPAQLDVPHFPPAFDLFRVEWERAAWSNAGRPQQEVHDKCALLRWRCHALLAELTGDLVHFHEAVIARPDLPTNRAALGCALARGGRLGEAVSHLRQAVQANPFDRPAARAFYQVLRDSGAPTSADRFAQGQRLWHCVAPQVVTAENWFAPVAPAAPKLGAATSPCRVVWEGPLRAAHSLGLVNRELVRGLLRRGHELFLLPCDPPLPPGDIVPLDAFLAEQIQRPLAAEAEVHVRLQWPPNPTAPVAGRWVLQQPWEYGSLPRTWLDFLVDQVDEVWIPSRFVRDCFVQSGVPAERVHIVPYGIDPHRFHPGAVPLSLQTQKRFKFLFVGGTIHRKGIDLLLKAYTQVFTRADDVCLVVKDMGVGTFYRGQTAEELIARYQIDANAPEIEYLSATLNEDALPGLYTACDCLVQPYRGEGFGLPILEALACGRPAIVTGYGPALDFCNDRCAYLLPHRLVRFPEKRVGELETVDYPWLAEPDVSALQNVLRHVAAHPEEARAKGEIGRNRIHTEFTWDRAVARLEERLQALRQQPIRRTETRPLGAGMVRFSSLAKSADCVSLCLIVKNEEQNLPVCLESVADLVEEIVVVDTGSTDATKEIAARFGAKIVDFPWVDSFSAARNESLRHATGQWIFWMDADDRLDPENRVKLRTLFAGLNPENAAYSMKCLCLPDADTGTATVVDHIRLFRNEPTLRWEHRIHEQILPAIRRAGGEVRWSDVVIHHAGYQDATVRRRKLERDLRLLELEHAELGDHPFTLFNLGSVYQELGRHTEAVTFLRRSLERSHPSDSIVRKLYALIVNCHRVQGQLAEALTACQEGRRVYPGDAELLFGEALLRREQKDWEGAAACLKQLLQAKPDAHFTSVDAGLRGYKARQNLGVIYRQQGKLDAAEQEWNAVVAERPDFLPAWLALGDLYLTQQRWPDLEEAAKQIERRPQGRLEAAVLRGRAELAQRNFVAARQRLEQTSAAYPQALWPRVILSHVLLQEGRDLAAAEKTLRDILTLDPEHAEARNNLKVLGCERQRQAADAVFVSEQRDADS